MYCFTSVLFCIHLNRTLVVVLPQKYIYSKDFGIFLTKSNNVLKERLVQIHNTNIYLKKNKKKQVTVNNYIAYLLQAKKSNWKPPSTSKTCQSEKPTWPSSPLTERARHQSTMSTSLSLTSTSHQTFSPRMLLTPCTKDRWVSEGEYSSVLFKTASTRAGKPTSDVLLFSEVETVPIWMWLTFRPINLSPFFHFYFYFFVEDCRLLSHSTALSSKRQIVLCP